MEKMLEHIKNYIPKNEQEQQDKKVILDCIKLFPNILLRENEIAHITSSGFILNKNQTKTLMVHHNIRNTWAWTGGHADGNSNLLEVAVREAQEETGVNAMPISNDIASIDVLSMIRHTKNGKYVNAHLHLSIAYVLIANEDDDLTVNKNENSAVEWLPIEYISEPKFASTDVYLYTKLMQYAKSFFQ